MSSLTVTREYVILSAGGDPELSCNNRNIRNENRGLKL